MPGAYIPRQPRRTQAVRSGSGAPAQGRRRFWWLPLLGLVPVVLIGVAAASGFFGRPQPAPVASGPPSASATSAAPTVAAPTLAAPTVAAPTPATAVTAQQTAAPTAVPTGAVATLAPTATAEPAATRAATTPTTGVTEAATPTSASVASAPFVAYRVQRGDTLRFIARMYGVSAASIAQASGLQNPDLLRVGQVLTIPSQPGWLYRVQPGDTLDQIAARNGVGTQAIASASGLTEATVAPGQVLLIPDASAVAQQSK